jgi:hypothetical protein
MLSQLVGSNLDTIIAKVSAAIGLPEAQARAFLEKALPMVEKLLKSGKVDAASLLSGGAGGASGLASKLDLGALAGLVGGDAGKAKQGAGAVVEGLLQHLSKDPAAAAKLAEQYGGAKGGMLGAIGLAAGKLLKK